MHSRTLGPVESAALLGAVASLLVGWAVIEAPLPFDVVVERGADKEVIARRTVSLFGVRLADDTGVAAVRPRSFLGVRVGLAVLAAGIGGGVVGAAVLVARRGPVDAAHLPAKAS